VKLEALLTVSGAIDPELEKSIELGLRPRADFVELSRALGGAVLLDRTRAHQMAGLFGRWVERIGGPDALMAWVCFRRRSDYGLLFTDGEQIGLPFSMLCRFAGRRSVRHAMIVHVMSTRSKSFLFRLFRLERHIDVFVTYATSQTDFLVRRLGVPADKVVQSTFMVDTEFFSPGSGRGRSTNMICAVGLERRDYRTLIEAVRGLDVSVVIAASSPWSQRGDTTEGVGLPPNVEVCSLDPVALRDLYADCRFLVMPLDDVDFQAGVTSLLEAMAMSKAVICSRTVGQTDVVQEGETGVYVTPGDATELRQAIEGLLNDPQRAERMGEAGRRYVVEHCDVIDYAERLASVAGRADRS
jgi:glycosyltransferase involved in cell wall biosynthesis